MIVASGGAFWHPGLPTAERLTKAEWAGRLQKSVARLMGSGRREPRAWGPG